MKVVKCPNGHFFDADTYPVCPHCPAASAVPPAQNPVAEKPKKKGLFGNRKAKKEKPDNNIYQSNTQMPANNQIPAAVQPQFNNQMPVNGQPQFSAQKPVNDQPQFSAQKPVNNQPQFSAQKPVNDQPQFSAQKPVNDQSQFSTQKPVNDQSQFSAQKPVNDQPQISIQKPVNDQPQISIQKPVKNQPQNFTPKKTDDPADENKSRDSIIPDIPSARNTADNKAPAFSNTAADQNIQTNEKKPEDLTATEKSAETNSQEPSLSEAIKRASANSEGKTTSYFSAVTSEKTGSDSIVPKHISEPVVGWLVCIKGVHFGESFSIAAGRNSIGRTDSNKIILGLDQSVSREKHAFIVYEPKKRNFFLQPGESSGLTYLNDEYITDSNLLKINDIIEIGNSQFLFVPLCGENFTWEDYMTKE